MPVKASLSPLRSHTLLYPSLGSLSIFHPRTWRLVLTWGSLGAEARPWLGPTKGDNLTVLGGTQPWEDGDRCPCSRPEYFL